ncbi:unnamed protein product [Polarella glacialis]|uniref:Uncharacterized protein n=1 Tax=Polarella glacialis TaxID=89957 RepID=A0A813KIT6_POLGL|nr:unnamed protein product [Polarella glacialis]CAE8708364.1 unnamed protein product [Polarella glacialis]
MEAAAWTPQQPSLSMMPRVSSRAFGMYHVEMKKCLLRHRFYCCARRRIGEELSVGWLPLLLDASPVGFWRSLVHRSQLFPDSEWYSRFDEITSRYWALWLGNCTSNLADRLPP